MIDLIFFCIEHSHMSKHTATNNMTRNNSHTTIPFVESDMANGCESGACGLAKTFYDTQARLLWRLKTRGELSSFYRSTFDSWAPEEVKSNPHLHRQFAQVMFALVNDGRVLRVNKGQYLVWTDPNNPANNRRNNRGPRHHGNHRGNHHRQHRQHNQNQQHRHHTSSPYHQNDDPPAFGAFARSNGHNNSSNRSSPRNWASSDGEHSD